jgi:hypothetical protein
MKPKKYNEFRVSLTIHRDGSYTIDSKTPTKRGVVSIHEHEAKLNNKYVTRTKLYYELAAEEQEAEDPKLIEAKAEADRLGIKYNKSISLENLLKKIETYKPA